MRSARAALSTAHVVLVDCFGRGLAHAPEKTLETVANPPRQRRSSPVCDMRSVNLFYGGRRCVWRARCTCTGIFRAPGEHHCSPGSLHDGRGLSLMPPHQRRRSTTSSLIEAKLPGSVKTVCVVRIAAFCGGAYNTHTVTRDHRDTGGQSFLPPAGEPATGGEDARQAEQRGRYTFTVYGVHAVVFLNPHFFFTRTPDGARKRHSWIKFSAGERKPDADLSERLDATLSARLTSIYL